MRHPSSIKQIRFGWLLSLALWFVPLPLGTAAETDIHDAL